MRTIIREAKKGDTIINYVKKNAWISYLKQVITRVLLRWRLRMSMLQWKIFWKKAREKGEAPFIFVLDNIEDPHNLGAMIRTANLSGAHGVIIPKRRAVGLTPTVARTSAGAINYTPVAKSKPILKQTMEQLKKRRHVVRMCRYGRYAVLSDGSERTDGSGNRKRRRRSQQINQRNL